MSGVLDTVVCPSWGCSRGKDAEVGAVDGVSLLGARHKTVLSRQASV